MAMITCPECKKRISETADRCPKCGYKFTPGKIAEIKKVEKQQVEKGLRIGCLFVLIIILFFIYLTNSGNKTPDKKLLLQEVDLLYVGGDLKIWYGMCADDLFEIVTPDDMVRQTIVKDPNDETAFIVTKLYRKWGKEFEIQLTVAKRGGPYSINKIVMLKE